MAHKGPYLQNEEVSALLRQGMAINGFTAEMVDDLAGYAPKASKTMKILKGYPSKIDVGTAEKLLRAVNLELNDCPSWISGNMLNLSGNLVEWEQILTKPIQVSARKLE